MPVCSIDNLLCRQFRDIAAVQGNKSQDKKIQLITKLLVSSRDLEPGYIMRALQVYLQSLWDTY